MYEYGAKRTIPGRSARVGRVCGLALACFSLVTACQTMPGKSGEERPVSLRVEGGTAVEEGSETVVFLERADAGDAEVFTLHLLGSAQPGLDFSADGFDLQDSGSLRLELAQGEESVSIRLMITDDVAAEPDEQILVELDPPSAYVLGTRDRRLELRIPLNDFVVTNTLDSGEGSLRQAILNANTLEGPDLVTFDSEMGPFGPPVEINLERSLPDITGELEIDGYVEGFLWKAAGTTISGPDKFRLFDVRKEAKLAIRNLTLSGGKARNGGAIRNRGKLVASGMMFSGNTSSSRGGAIINDGGRATVINSTFYENRARSSGGAVANRKGSLLVTNSTFSDNSAKTGGAVANEGALLLRNSILANSLAREDCLSSGTNDSASTHNIIETNGNCPGVLHEADPGLARLDYYNGMTRSFSLAGRSLAVNSGDNDSALDENGEPLTWDQRGNGDPRFVAGVTDIGAFEVQAFPKLVVDTLEDGGPQGCSGMRGDCPLRAAIRLADLDGKSHPVTFDPYVFRDSKELILDAPLDRPETNVLIDAGEVSDLTIRVITGERVFGDTIPDTVELRGLNLE